MLFFFKHVFCVVRKRNRKPKSYFACSLRQQRKQEQYLYVCVRRVQSSRQNYSTVFFNGTATEMHETDKNDCPK